MTERSYRSGAQRSCLLCRQPEDIRTKVKKMGENHSYNEITGWLKDRDIIATWSQVRYFLLKSGVPSRTAVTSPKNTYAEKLNAYITELVDGNFESYSIRSLHLRGPSWTEVTVRLHKDGLIEPMRDYSPIMWRVLASKDEINEWRNKELMR